MAKKQKEETTNVNATANRDVVQRLNFLYQASIYLQSVTPSGSSNKEKAREIEENIAETHPEAMDIDKDSPKQPSVPKNEDKLARKRPMPKVGAKRTTGDLARSYVQCMRIVGQKTTVKIDPCLKRSLCSGCSSTLIPGSSASIRIKKSPSQGHIITYTCLHCRATKRIPAPPNGTANGSETINRTDSGLSLPGTNVLSSSGSNGVMIPAPPAGLSQSSNKKRRFHSRPLPLFARPDAGHVIFRGNERLALDEQTGLGVIFS